ncbi:uncharacterized protein VTP21DRAFT_9795 [Calcarisporiella thermophila]|uniref:uncharacterized protein n=1 Tax=Calcarisporiella thermophila TaxID=911321 RepID=UPI003743EE16
MSSTEVSERKLRPLYDAVDSGNNKLALQLCNKMLKKQPNALILKALKAVALERSNKEEEALALCDEVRKAEPADESVLQATTHVYASMGKHDEVIAMYEAAARQQPNNEEFCNMWFMAMVRKNDFKGQQQAALKNHKNFKSNKYLFWAIMSLILQAKQVPAGQPNIFYPLAERMIAKAAQEKRIRTAEEVQLYLNVLIAQNKHADALAVIENEFSEICKNDPEIQWMRLELLANCNKWPTVNSVVRTNLLKINPDEWQYFQFYLDSLFKLLDQEIELENGSLIYDKSIADARKFLSSLQQQLISQGQDVKRGVFLAEIELECRIIKERKQDALASTVPLVASYFERFSSKTCCFEDLQPYVKCFSEQEISELLDMLRSKLPPLTTNAKAVQRHINFAKLERFLGQQSKLSVQELSDLADNLWKAYNSALPLGKNLEETERQYGDEFVILASHLLVDAYHKDNANIRHLFRAIFWLEAALQKSKHNFQFKLLLIRLYQIIGVYQRALSIYETMDIKQVQLDTLLHFATEHAMSLGQFDHMQHTFANAAQIYSSNNSETPDMLVLAYKNGTYSKIEEFIAFRRKLDDSLQRGINKLTTTRMGGMQRAFSIKMAMDYFKGLDLEGVEWGEEFCNAREDNRDYEVMLDFANGEKETLPAESATRPGPHLTLESFRIYAALLALISSAAKGEDTSKVVEAMEKMREGAELTTAEQKLFDMVMKLESAIRDETDPAVFIEKAILAVKAVALESSPDDTVLTLTWKGFHRYSVLWEMCTYAIVLGQAINSGSAKTKKAPGKTLLPHVEHLYSELASVLKQALGNLARLLKEVKSSGFNDTVLERVGVEKSAEERSAIGRCVHSWRLSLELLNEELNRLCDAVSNS